MSPLERGKASRPIAFLLLRLWLRGSPVSATLSTSDSPNWCLVLRGFNIVRTTQRIVLRPVYDMFLLATVVWMELKRDQGPVASTRQFCWPTARQRVIENSEGVGEDFLALSRESGSCFISLKAPICMCALSPLFFLPYNPYAIPPH
jgi:hypothetical protein